MGRLSKLFLRRPLLVNTVSSGVLLAAGDAIQQCIEFRRGVHKETRYNWRRTGRMLVVGLLEGPPHYWWYTGLDRLLPGRTARVVRLKILADQLLAAPLFAFTFFVGVDLLEGRTLNDGVQEFKRKFPEVYLFDWCIWPPTQWLNFTYVPERYRVLYVNMVTVIWDVFLSYSKHRDQLEPGSEDAAKAALRQLRAAQISVSALESDQTDTADFELLDSNGTDSADGGLREDYLQTADSGRTETRAVPGAHSERRLDGDSEGVDGRLLSEGADRAELCRRRRPTS